MIMLGDKKFYGLEVEKKFYVKGGFEINYRSIIHSIVQIKDYRLWQNSGLSGVTKIYKAGKKGNGEIKLLWDFLSYSNSKNSGNSIPNWL